MKNSFMIVGGNFVNKGAQAMTYVVVDELRKRFPECKVHMYSALDYRRNDKKQYCFEIYDDTLIRMSLGEQIKYMVVAIAKAILGRRNDLASFIAWHRNKKSYTAMIDISGYALFAAKNLRFAKIFLDNINVAHRNGISIFVLPQSFGPFDFKEEADEMNTMIRENMVYPQRIYAREMDGYLALIEKYNLQNVQKAVDIVLQNGGIDKANVFKFDQTAKLSDIEKGSVAVIPNMRNFDYSDKEVTLNVYIDFVKALLQAGRKVYLLRHADEDIIVCKWIKENFCDNEKVVWIKNDLNCLEYEEMVQKFDFLVASRFHSIVHAYKQGIPCIVMGWAVKYHELTGLFGQEKYLFDVRTEVESEKIHEAVKNMNQKYMNESQHILEELERIRQMNIFDEIKEIVEGINK